MALIADGELDALHPLDAPPSWATDGGYAADPEPWRSIQWPLQFDDELAGDRDPMSGTYTSVVAVKTLLDEYGLRDPLIRWGLRHCVRQCDLGRSEGSREDDDEDDDEDEDDAG
ncbi:MAG: hypothetical protein AAGN66_16220 [Acidobacteriota bacterium]